MKYRSPSSLSREADKGIESVNTIEPQRRSDTPTRAPGPTPGDFRPLASGSQQKTHSLLLLTLQLSLADLQRKQLRTHIGFEVKVKDKQTRARRHSSPDKQEASEINDLPPVWASLRARKEREAGEVTRAPLGMAFPGGPCKWPPLATAGRLIASRTQGASRAPQAAAHVFT